MGCLPSQLSKNNFKDSNLGAAPKLQSSLNLNKLAGSDLVNISNKLFQSMISMLMPSATSIINPSKYRQLINNSFNSEKSLFLNISLRYLRFGQFW